VGGLDGLGLTRRELLWQTGLWLGPDEERTRARGRSDDPQLPIEVEDPDAGRPFRELEDRDRMLAEYRMLRFSTDLHPLALVRDRLPRETISSERLATLPQGAVVTLAGVVIARQRPHTAKGYVFILMEDEFGHVNVIVKPAVYEKCRAAVRMEPFLSVRGRLQRDGSVLNVIALEVAELEVASPGPGAIRKVGHPRNDTPPPDAQSPFAYLTALRQTPPDAKSWG
jgi:error-prone DNA polymerase